MANALFEDGDLVTESALAEYMLHDVLADYVKSGATITTDFANDQITVAAGTVYLDDGGSLYYIEVDETTLTLPAPSGDNFVFAAYDPSTDDAATYEIDTAAGNVADPKLQIATVDAAGQTVTEESRTPDADLGDVSIDALTAALDAGGFDISNIGNVTATNADLGALLSSLDAGGFDISNIGTVAASTGTFTDATVSNSPTADTDVAIKSYVDSVAQGLDWQDSVIDELNDPPASPSDGDRYLIDDSPIGDWSGHPNEIAEYDGGSSSWDFFTPNEGWATFVEDIDLLKVYDSGVTDWIEFGSAIDHGALAGLSDDDHTQYLLVDGTRAMSGALDMGTNAVTNASNGTFSGTIASALTDTDQVQNKDYNESINTQTATTGTVTIDLSTANYHEIEADGDITIAFSNVSSSPPVNSLTLYLYDDDTTGPHTITWPASVEWSNGNAETTIPSDGDIEISLISPDGGTTWRARLSGEAFA